MTITPSIVATLATRAAIDDLRILLSSLHFWNERAPDVYLYCDTAIAKVVPALKYAGRIFVKEALDAYTPYTRAQMERMPGKQFATLWFDFMTEKINLLRWAFDESKGGDGVLFCDADICFLAPLPQIPSDAKVALSPHMIREADSKRFGHYNGGFAWFLERRWADVWWEKCGTARYYEQSALEDVAAEVRGENAAGLYEFPVTQNYGWWRMWQGDKTPEELQAEWKIHRGDKQAKHSAIIIGSVPLGSVHTHFHERKDIPTMTFNRHVKELLTLIAMRYEPTRKFLKFMKWAVPI
jgi:hypothetical protein